MGICPTLFREWLALFLQTALPIIGAELTGAWILRAVPLAHEFPVTGDGDVVQWARAANCIGEIQDDWIVFVG
jgi:hypothetical protein